MSGGLDELKAKHERLQHLYEVSNVIHSSLDPSQALDLILGQALQLTNANSASVSLVNPTTGFLELEASCGLPSSSIGFRLRIGQGITGWVARTGKPARCGKVAEDSRYVPVRKGVNSELAVPMDIRGEVRGVLNVDSDVVDAFGDADQSLLEELAVQAAKVIQNTWLYEQLRFKARMFESLVAVNQSIQSTVNLDEALDSVTREARNLMSVKLCSLLMLDETGESLELRSSIGAGQTYLGKPRLDIRESMAGSVVRSQRPVQVMDVRVSGIYQHTAVAEIEGLVSLLCVPLIHGENCIGVLNVYTDKRHSFSDEEIRILTAFASASATAIEKARLYDHMRGIEEKLRQNEKLSALGLLAAEIAHEIRNPLTVMKMIYHALDLKFDEGDPRARDARVLGDKMDHLNRIVERILAFARQSDPLWEVIDVNLLLDDLGLLTRHKLKKHGIELKRELDSAIPRLEADATQLEQAFLNLTLNAVEAMPKGGRLTIRTKRLAERHRNLGGGQIAIEFEDTGEGMTEQIMSRTFHSVLDSQKSSGVGLGLAIVGRIVETHSGEIKLKSSVGVGTTFTVVLPVEQPAETARGVSCPSP
ncbi:MAG: Sensor protein ZraS [Verrucomicrobia subdivision 3 bacterium]|nr:Sensor protein ZraS [Limisphaerales bacterium]MCS1416740.1 Sensor protein ZraS [Limisphaerales bacterium]